MAAADFVRSQTVGTLISLFKANPTMGFFLKQSPLVHDNREKIVDDVLANGTYTHLFFVDSVTPDTPILVRNIGDNWINFVEACELLPESARFAPRRIYRHVDYEVLTHKGWQVPKAVMQAKVKKPILRITDESGTVCITEDHSIFSNGKSIAGRDIQIGTKLDRISLGKVESVDNKESPITENYAEVLGFFAAEGTAGYSKFSRGGGINFWALSNSDKKLLEQYAKVLESVHTRHFSYTENKKDDKNGKPYKSVWALRPSCPKDLVLLYRDMFYTATGKKKVPKIILNAPENIVNAFLLGYEKGDGHETSSGQQVTTNSMALAAGINYLYQKVGRDFAVNAQRPDKPSIISLRERKYGKKMMHKPAGVRHIQRDEKYNGWVYDLNTEAGTFVGGVGLFLLHNSDMVFAPDVLDKLIADDKDIIGAMYNRRMGKLNDPVVNTRFEVMPNYIFKNFNAGTGCLLIKTEVFKKIPKPWFFYGSEQRMLGEDVFFCEKAKNAGFAIWIHPNLNVGHIGEFRY